MLRNPSCGAQNMAVLRHILTAAPPRLAASASGSARRRSPARACLGQVLSNKKETVTKSVTVSFWQGQKDLVSPAGSVGASALRAEVSTGDPHPSTRSACRVFKLFNPNQNKKTPAGVFLFWQGQKDLNPRHAVLETAALPTELYPYIKFFLAEITLILYIYCIILSTIIISKCFYEASF